jgi:hypothetical protein
MYITNEIAVGIAKEVVEEHAPSILTRLGFYIDDEVLNRFTFSTETTKDTPLGRCTVTTLEERYGGRSEYVKGSARITIYPVRFLYRLTRHKELIRRPFARFFKNSLRKRMIRVLAHELRHYWQHESGEIERNEASAFGIIIMPYEVRWSERDADDFAKEYLESLKGGRK